MNHQILVQLPLFPEPDLTRAEPEKHGNFINLHDAWQHPECLPTYMTRSPTIMRILDLIGPLDWVNFPERDLKQTFGFPPVPYAALIAAEIIKLNENHQSLKQLHLFLSEHPGFISLLNFAPKYRLHYGFSFNTPPPTTCLPTERHLTRMLREIPNAVLQFLLADSIHLIGLELAKRNIMWGDCISLDTNQILAWVKENNHKAYVRERYNKLKQPVGDLDCRLGCKRRRNRPKAPQTPTKKPVSAKGVAIGEFYWGYGSGVVVTKVPLYGEFIVAELTRPFDNIFIFSFAL